MHCMNVNRGVQQTYQPTKTNPINPTRQNGSVFKGWWVELGMVRL